MQQSTEKPIASQQQGLFSLLKPYRGLVSGLVVLALLGNGLSLYLPKLISRGIDGFLRGSSSQGLILQFGIAAFLIFILAYLQGIVQTYVSERVARDTRRDFSAVISSHSYGFVQKITPSRLLTNLTSDVDSIKMFVAQAIVNIVSSVFIILGAGALLLSIDWQLGLAVLAVVPIIAGTFYFVLSKVRVLFVKTREVIDRLNKVINESILGAALIRVLNSQQPEYEKFMAANSDARDLGLSILRLFASMIPVITFSANLAVLVILTLGGHFVISGNMSLGDFAAFNSYLAILIFPILIIGFMSNIIAQAQASYGRIREVMNEPVAESPGTLAGRLEGRVAVKNATLRYGEKTVLKDVSLDIEPKTRTALLGPTAAGKTQLLYALIGLVPLDEGGIEYDGHDIHDYAREQLYRQVGFVFQDSIIFNMSLRENIAFNTEVTEANMHKAVETAELSDFVAGLPQGLETVVSERGASLSGGQKQRIMLARALALNPRILFLDDFTARVDGPTERRILENVARNYPDLTLVSVTQKISSVERYDRIVLLMEGEVIASGTHESLMESSPEYVQIYNSQQSTSAYELQPE